jgi:hypothetical protein
MNDDERTKLEHDWLMARFTVSSGALLTTIFAVLLGVVARQWPATGGWLRNRRPSRHSLAVVAGLDGEEVDCFADILKNTGC